MADVTRLRRRGWLGVGALGVVLLIPFDSALPIALGIVCLVTFVAWGVALIATPEFLAGDEPDPPDGAGATP